LYVNQSKFIARSWFGEGGTEFFAGVDSDMTISPCLSIALAAAWETVLFL
jgi:hypothetical protein